ncbi:MAG TPA: 1-acyl-sn-glycerol-3-phosphate acyltransferase [Bacteroidetes bacterium]|nr:1-acyl-sn-glycerol-3-phosphate acyltransferase [Bacteroidota bacterium]
MFRTIFIRAWSIVCIFIFCSILIPGFTLLLIAHNLTPLNKRYYYYVPGIISKVSFWLMGIMFVFIDNNKPDKSKKMIYVFNHSSNLDPIMASSLTIGFTKFIGKAEVLNYPIFGYMLKHFYISVDRKDSQDRYKSLLELEEAIHEGASIVLFPEATRNKSDNMIGPFKDGAFKLSLKTKVPIAMLTALNSRDIMAPDNWWLSPGKLYCKWDIIDWTDKSFTEENIISLREHSWGIMNNNLKLFYNNE